jgi:hypothetical protein
MLIARYWWPAEGTEWEDAERDLLEALGKDAKDADTLANLVTVSAYSAYAAPVLVWCSVSCLLHCQGCCLQRVFGCGKECWRDLLEALGKDAKDADTLANLVTMNPCVCGDSAALCPSVSDKSLRRR